MKEVKDFLIDNLKYAIEEKLINHEYPSVMSANWCKINLNKAEITSKESKGKFIIEGTGICGKDDLGSGDKEKYNIDYKVEIDINNFKPFIKLL